MNFTYQERQELNELSKKAFGSSSRWKKLLDNGYFETWERDRQAMVPGTDGRMDKRTFTDRKQVSKYPTLEEIRKVMVDQIAKKNTAEAPVKFEGNQFSVSSDSGLIPEGTVLVSPETHGALKEMLVNE